ncbi:hypothetical protein J2W50_004973 [Herbaspirillum frisingense]|uniref:Alkyl hydroperoxide reductase subunit C/ Thiol specific antioxidant domain-containing protein n=1 Tax=Herbaspirillum frisingense TaxID=92645 RepID=A0ABU1PML9_9BURK|nr:hypothetical protein [Herbaspirillum frisingense]
MPDHSSSPRPVRLFLRGLIAGGALLAVTLASPLALAALKPGDKAPEFSAPASLGGQVSTFSLSAALKKGPVVLYFYPAAFTSGLHHRSPPLRRGGGSLQGTGGDGDWRVR